MNNSMVSKTAAGSYCNSLTQYVRRESIEIKIGDVPLGAQHPIRVQSMTTIDTMDTIGTVEQSIRMIEAGCEYVRITAPSMKEAENLANIKAELKKRGFEVPLIADIHFTPNAAEIAARIVEKVRVNPGNYVDKKKFQQIEYTDQQYREEIERIRDRFSPLVKICKAYGTAMRIGTNHGSLSDRIMSRYGDTPLGMVESALEFLRICEDENYFNIVLSMKASNTQVMVQAYRLLVQKLNEEGLKPYPLHLGVTEAGEAEDGRIKSAVGIGLLLEDGLGDTIRVSLTEDPEFEIPVALDLVNRYKNRPLHPPIAEIENYPVDPFAYARRASDEVDVLGAANVPRVMVDLSKLEINKYEDLAQIGHRYHPTLDKFSMTDQGADFVYSGSRSIPFMLPNGLKEIVDYEHWLMCSDHSARFPLISFETLDRVDNWHPKLNFVQVDASEQYLEKLLAYQDKKLVILLRTTNNHGMAEQRRFFVSLINLGLRLPVVVNRNYDNVSPDQFLLHASTDVGGLLIDGLGDGLMLTLDQNNNPTQIELVNRTSFGILQAARTRITKTEYISCPSCGRTLFDLQETTAMIRSRTDHLKGVKIGIMGCIVNGPGEMADADYGYVGSGKGKITLYKGMNVIKKSVPSAAAVDELIDIIKADGAWIEPSSI
ncbi:MAG: (E)-4-hydroxy-3-methylbut-2-enyl-diphosphate synthase [Cyclobacteriaceae bacterium]|nr:(E)-4-hydroxy-3-methylbut-2-enyl-diphosphate synthase [Cyclobacteriaceae bacterium]